MVGIWQSIKHNKIIVAFITLVLSPCIVGLIATDKAYELLKSVAFFEVGGSLGWNWFPIICIGVMLYIGFSKSAEIMKPLNRKNLALVVCMTVFPLLFYYSFLDMFPRLLSTIAIYSIRGIDPTPFVSNYLIWVTLVNVLPTNLIGFFMYAGFTYAFAWKRLDFKYLAVAFLVGFTTNAVMFWFFGVLNIRLLPESSRVLVYYTTYLPGWLLFTFCYAKMWRKNNKIPNEEEKILMGD